MTPSRITRLDGYGSPLRGATENGPPRGGRHQPLLSRLPTVFVNYTGDQVPAFRVQMDDGTFLSSEDLLGKPSLILFFHTSCPDCARTIPVVQKAYERYAGQIRFVAISRAQNADEIKSWWKEFGITIPFSAQKDRQVYQLFASSRIPRVYICNSKGIVVSSYDDNPCPTYENLEQDLDKLQ